MAYPRKIQSALSILAAAGIRKSSYAPLLHRALWSLGIEIAPPHFSKFSSIFLVYGGWFGVAWGITMWATTWSHQGMSPTLAAVISFAAGVLFGFAMAIYIRHTARKHNLPSWGEVAE
jgi:hypothetical protein